MNTHIYNLLIFLFHATIGNMKRLYSIALISVGVSFMTLGIAGIFLPILQGILFLVIGASILAIALPSLKKPFSKYSEKYKWTKTLVVKIEKLEKSFRKFLGIGEDDK